MSSPSVPPGYNFLQSIPRTIKQVWDPIGSMEESMARHHGTYSVMLGSAKFIVTQDPRFIDHVLRGNHRNYQKSPIVTQQLGRFLGKGLLTSNGEYWLRQRRLIQPGFHAEKIHALYDIMERTIDRFLTSIPTGQPVDVYPLMNQLAFDLVINTLFNVDVPQAVQAELGRLIYELQDYVIRDLRQVYKRWWFRLSGENARHLRKAERLRDIIRGMIRDRQSSSQRFNDLLDMLLEARYEDNGEPMKEEQLIDEITILIIAGHETTANALAWTLYLAANHPSEQDQLHNEASSVSVREAVMSEYLNCVVKESMRLYPPAWISDRLSMQDDTFNNFLIPKDTIIVLFYYGLHRDSGLWKNSESFIPARFSKNNLDKELSKAFYPFGAGPRLCIGNNFAMAEMTIFLQRFFQSFYVNPTDQKPKLVPLVTLKPDRIVLEIGRRVARR